jgi:hypothetical protein
MVVCDKGHNDKSPLALVVPFRSYAIERHRSGEDVERRIRAIRSAGGQVLAVGRDDDRRFEQRARLAVAQLTNGSWGGDRARRYLQDVLPDGLTPRDESPLTRRRRRATRREAVW